MTLQGDVPDFTYSTTSLTGTGKSVSFTEKHKGTRKEEQLLRAVNNVDNAEISGNFTLTFGGQTTDPIQYANGTCAESSAEIKQKLEALSTIG